ncbi:MAG: YjbH domain-containing protein [Rhodocyclaceae bacterium]|nr:YjbH domain-containing protein [Rhodocyclaceae bacterium]
MSIDCLASDTLRLKDGSRLSDWLVSQGHDVGSYPVGLSWQVPAQREAQSILKHRLLARLGTENFGESAEARARLAQWLRDLPVTGRVPLPVVDARWLQAHPERDPILDAEHLLVMPRRPATLKVISSSARQCAIRHVSGTEAGAYLRRALGNSADAVDMAWIVQPDGRVQRVNVANWNMAAQDEPAPGAWIWAPERDANWPNDFSQALAEFVATQGVSSAISASDCNASATEIATQSNRDPARAPYISSNDWGFAGLMQTPTARMAEAGELRFQYSSVFPYDRGSVVLQPLDWLEGGFRYTNIRNRFYGPASLSGNQAYKDKSLDLKFRLVTETATRPQVALGIIDIGGTGFFSSEYVVASKRIGDFDWSAGIAWGYLGAAGNIKNPLSVINSSFSARTGNTTSTGGTIGINSFFHGPAALFGGVQYQTPVDGLLVKLEYDGNDYQHEPQFNNQTRRSPINLGVVYRVTPTIDLNAGIERGNTLMFGLTFHGALDKMGVAKPLDATTPRVLSMRPTKEPDWKQTATDLEAQTQWSVRQIQRKDSELNIVLESVFGIYVTERLDKAVAVLHRDAPEGISRFVFTFTEGGIAFSDWVVLRDEWVAKRVRYRAAAEQFEAIAAAEPRSRSDFAPLWAASPNKFTYGYAPTVGRILGGRTASCCINLAW